ncbi:MAG TPA: N-acetylmuramoyl-L-alanine amidase [Gemmatimonadota bacterium]|nr:N-acetylmuramoyl-L-alanine amidase [Gemmatimonadota bacterium]
MPGTARGSRACAPAAWAASAALTLLFAQPGAARAQDELALTVQYPPAGATVTATDSTFVFGRVDGADGEDVALTVNRAPVPVHAGGGWIAFVPLEPDSFTFEVAAVSGGRRAETRRTVWVPRSPLEPPAGDTLGYRPETIQPQGPLELYAGDTVQVSVVAAPDVEIRARLGEASVRLVPELPDVTNAGRLVFDFGELPETHWTAVPPPATGGPWKRYAGDLYLPYSGEEGDSLRLEFTGPDGKTRTAAAAAISFLDPTAVRTAALDDDTAGTGRTDHRVIARYGPGMGYYLFLPNGTRAATGRRSGDWRELALGPGTRAWAPLGETFPTAAARPGSRITVIRSRLEDGWSEIVIPTTDRLPFRIVQELDPVRYTIRVFGAAADVDYVHHTFDDRLLESVVWGQPETGVLEIEVALAAERAWGYRAYWEGSHLVIGFRHAPRALSDRRFRSPLHGVRVIVDPGHNPDPGAVGPTGLEEREANLGISLELARILERRGADVVLTRASADSGLGLYDRTNLAIGAGGELFVSIHNNALPDGVNPLLNNGTSVLYYHPQSRELAEAIQAELLPRTGLADRGVWHQNVAVLRMNEMPAVLVESVFMMIPEQEAALRTPEFRRRIAEGVAAGIERYLDGRTREAR